MKPKYNYTLTESEKVIFLTAYSFADMQGHGCAAVVAMCAVDAFRRDKVLDLLTNPDLRKKALRILDMNFR